MLSVFLKKSNVWQTGPNLFKYLVYMYGSEAITYLNIILWMVTEPALFVIRLPPTLHYSQPSPPLASYYHPFGMVNCHTCVQKQSKNGMVKEPSHIKQLSLNHVCKIGLKHPTLKRRHTKQVSPVLHDWSILRIRGRGSWWRWGIHC